jgi:REP element-mobilizing transposase RayT
MLVSMARDLSPSQVVRNIKTDSSKWIHETFPELAGFHWQDGYAAFSVSHSQLGMVRAYIARQKEHHKKQSFQDELRELLRRHGIEFDERYLWD